MARQRIVAGTYFWWVVAGLLASWWLPPFVSAQAPASPAAPVRFKVTAPVQKLEMIVNTSRILTVDHNVPRLLVQNTEIIQATPLSPNQIQISALKPGVTAVNLWDEKDQIHVVDVRVLGDVRELKENLATLFPDAQIDLRPLSASLVLSGYVPRPEMVEDIVHIAEDYYPKVINRLQVGGAQTVLLHVKVLEVSRTKLRRLGIDWALLTGNDFVIQSVSGLVSAGATQAGVLTGTGADTLRWGVINNQTQFGNYIDLLRQNNLAKLLAEPTLVATSGRPASFNVGGEVPVPVSAGLGVTSVEYREFGTTIDFVPIVLGNGRIKLEVRPQITEIDPSLRDPVTGTPGFRSRRVDTGVEMQAGQTLALAGLIQNRIDAENRGIPWVADLPWIGAAFRSVEQTVNEVELLVMVTPELVEPLDAHQVPHGGPGMATTSPNDVDLYWRGYLEVPRCCPDGSCAACQDGPLPSGPVGPVGPAPLEEELPAVPPVTSPPAPTPAAPSAAPGRNRAALRTSRLPAVTADRTHLAPVITPQRTGQAPVSQQLPAANRYNRTVPKNPNQTPPEMPAPTPDTRPALIGPLGYDVLN